MSSVTVIESPEEGGGVGGSSAVTGTSVIADWSTRQTEPDGSFPSGSSLQSTCINEDPEAGRATKDTCMLCV